MRLPELAQFYLKFIVYQDLNKAKARRAAKASGVWAPSKKGTSKHAIALRRPLAPDLNSLGDAETESAQLITANESLFEREGRGVH